MTTARLINTMLSPRVVTFTRLSVARNLILCKKFASVSRQQSTYALPDYSKTRLEYKPITYETWQKVLNDEQLPAAIVDLDAFDRNTKTISEIAEQAGKTVRIATKSIRVPSLIKRILDSNKSFQGVMCYSAQEAALLFKEEKINDLLVAYPTAQKRDLQQLRSIHDAGTKISLVIDSEEHLKLLSEEMKGSAKPFPVVIEMDMSLRYLSGIIHLGARRSPVRTTEALKELLEKSKKYPSIKVIGVMAYEAVVAGLPDHNSPQIFRDPIARIIREMARQHIAKTRSQIPEIFKSAGIPLEIFNGGGTGSINFAVNEKALTEITVGSAFYCSHLFSNRYSNIGDTFIPSFYFALSVGRVSDNLPGATYVTCNGGGIIASGAVGVDKLPKPVLPEGLELTADEGAGEVQTPLRVTGKTIPRIGQPVLFRPAKAGETCEHFSKVVLLQQGEKMSEVPTYRSKVQ